MKSRFNYGQKPAYSVEIVCAFDEQQTKQGLAYTPDQLMSMAKEGIPISSGNVSQLPTQGVASPSWEVPLECKRGTDVSDLWSAEKAARAEFSKTYKKAKSDSDFQKSLQEQRDKETLEKARQIVNNTPKTT